MANISKELQAWKDARLGKDVRQAQIDLSTKINAEVEKNTTTVEQGMNTINAAVTRAETAADLADTKAAAANTAAAAANIAAAKAEGYVLGDITDKTVTYTEPEQTGANAPASGAKISTVVGWVVKRIREMGESIAGINSKMTNNLTSAITWNSAVIDMQNTGCSLHRTSAQYTLKIFCKNCVSLTANTVYLLGTLPQENRPYIQTNAMCYTFTGLSGYVVVSTGGRIEFTPYTNINANYWIFGDVTYFGV